MPSSPQSYGAKSDVFRFSGIKPRYPVLNTSHPMSESLVAAFLFNQQTDGLAFRDSALAHGWIGYGSPGGFGLSGGVPTYTKSPWGTALHLHGSGQVIANRYGTLGGSPFRGLDNAKWAVITARVRLISTPATSVTICRQQDPATDSGPFAFGVGWDAAHNLPRCYFKNNLTDGWDWVEATTPVDDNKWHVITTLFAPGNAYIFVDGHMEGSSTMIAGGNPILTLMASTTDLSIGAYGGAASEVTEVWNGDIEHIQIWAGKGGFNTTTSRYVWEIHQDPYAHFRTMPLYKQNALRNSPAVTAPKYSIISHTSGGNGQDAGTTGAIDTTGADLLVVVVSFYSGRSVNPVITDSKGNSWTGLTIRTAGNICTQMFYAKNATVGSGHTFTQSTTFGFASMEVLAFHGSDLTAPFDVENGSSAGGSQSSISTGSVTPSQADSLVVCGLGAADSSSGYTIDSGFTVSDTLNFTGGREGSGSAYLIESTIAAANPTWSLSSGSTSGVAAVIAVFKAAAPGARLVDLRIKKTTVAGRVPTSLSAGELAINLPDKKLFSANDTAIFTMNTIGGNTDVFFNDSGFLNALDGIEFDKVANTTSVANTFIANAAILSSGANVGANAHLTTTALAIGNTTANVSSNSILLSIANSTATTNVNPSGIIAGTTSANGTTFTSGANVLVNASSVAVGNSTANLTTNSSSIVIGVIRNPIELEVYNRFGGL